MLVLVFTVLVGVLMIMAPCVGTMVVSMCMLVLMVVSLIRSMHVIMPVEVFMRVRTLHG
ncbi:MAG: hypothetical protein NTAFB01_23180 [Nitrospira sp.]